MKIRVGILLVVALGTALVVVNALKEKSINFQASTDQLQERAMVKIGNQTFVSEVARTDAQQQQGLSDRAMLNHHTGMLFPLPQSEQPDFWMKGMHFPLDIIWIGNNQVVDISPNLPIPLSTTPLTQLPLYSPKVNCNAAFEINAGESSGIHIGDPVTINYTVGQ